jgi:MFS family permease
VVSSEVSGEAKATTRSERPFLGWQMTAVAFVAQFLAMGVTFSIIGNLVGPISREFGVSRASVGVAPGVSILIMGIAGPFVGRFLDRGWARRMMTAGSMLTGIGLILASYSNAMWQLAVVFVFVICVGVAMFGMLPSMSLVTNWFEHRRGLALGIAVAGATVASWVAPALAQWIIDDSDWRNALLYFGIATCLISLPVFGTLVVGRPEDVGQLPDGQIAKPDATPEVDLNDTLAPGELARDARLWLAAIGFGLVLTSPVVLVSLLVPFGESLGFSAKDATFFFAAMVPFSLAGKVVIGGLADVAPLKPSIVLIVLMNVAVWMILFTEPSYELFIVTGALYGIGIGGASPVHGVLTARLFGRVNFGTASGIGGMAAVPLIAAANIGSQIMLEATGSFQQTFVAQMCLIVLGGLMLAFLKIPPAPDRS